jgi:predicted small lipoprotein YifL
VRLRLPALIAITAITLSLTACFGPRVPLEQPDAPQEAPAAEAPATREELEVVEIAFGREERDPTI